MFRLRKRFSIILALILALSTCFSPAYAQQSVQYPADISGERPIAMDEKYQDTDKNSEVSGSIEEASTENPYGAEKVGESSTSAKASSQVMQLLDALSSDGYGDIAYEHLVYLSETIGTRVADNLSGADVAADDSEVAAREYLYGEFEDLGYEVSTQNFIFNRSGKNYDSANIIAEKQGASNKVVIVGAHYDSVSPAPVWINPPEAGEATVSEAVYMYGKGADDNASGVAIMLEAASRLADIETPYTIKFIAFGAEEKGLRGSRYYVSQMTESDIANTVAMINLDSCIAGDDMNVYGDSGEKGWVRELALDIAERLALELKTQEGLNPEYPAGTTGPWSDHAPFLAKGIPYAYFEATNWTLGAMDGYTQVDTQYGIEGEIWHTGYDNIDYIEDTFPGRIEERLSTFAKVLTNLLVQLEEPGQGVVGLSLNDYLVSMTAAEEIEVTADLGYMPDLANLEWTLGGKAFSDWKEYNSAEGAYTGAPYISFVEEPSLNGSIIKARIKFGLPYNTENLTDYTDYPTKFARRLYPALIGNYELAIKDTYKEETVSAIIKYNAYDSYHTYDEIKLAIDDITENAKSGRYIEYKSLGETVEGRAAHFVILAEDEAAVDQYLNETMPMMLENPQALQNKIEANTMGEYKVPVWFNNIHPDEAPGIDAIIELFEQFATQDEISYKTMESTKVPRTSDSFGTNIEDTETETTVTIDVDDVLDDVIFLFNFTENPDGRYYNTRANVNGFDINRDNVYQTQVEARLTTSEIVKWKPMSFLDFHGFVDGFLIEPCTTPHDPNFEYDLLIDNMLEHAHLMGKAGVANTKYTNYEIPFEDHPGGWDDGVPSYTAVFAMMLGALGHTIEIPELNESSVDALVAAGLASVNFVAENKDRLYNNQLEYYQRGIEGIDAKELVDPWMQDAEGNEIGRPRGENENFFPEYYVIPVDSGIQKSALEAYELVEYMLRNGVEVEKSTAEVTADDIIYPSGSYVIDMRQPLRAYANEILFDGYDVSEFAEMYAEIVNAFHDTRGFDRYEVRTAGVFTGKTESVTAFEIPSTEIAEASDFYVIKNNNNDVVTAVNKLLKEDRKVEMLLGSGTGYSKGDYVVSGEDLSIVADDYFLEVAAYNGNAQKVELVKPTVAVPSASGHLTFVLRELGFDITGSKAEGNIIVTDANTNVSSEIEAGKPYIGIGGNAMRFISNTLRLEGFGYINSGYEALMRGTFAQDSLITSGYPKSGVIYNAKGGYISSVPEGAKVLTRINEDDTYFKAGWWPDTEIDGNTDYGKLQSKGKALAITAKVGTADARVTVFANNLANKAHPQSDWRMLANAVFTSLVNSVSPAVASFDKMPAIQADVTVAITGSQLSSIMKGQNELLPDKDYTISGDNVIIKAAYLAELPIGATTLNFIFAEGDSCTLTISVINSSIKDESSGRGRSGSSTLTTQAVSTNKIVLAYEKLAAGNMTPHVVTKLQTAFGVMELPDNMLTGTGLAKAGDSIGISFEKAAAANIPEALRKQIGEKPVYDINLEVNGVRKLWNNPDAPVKVSVNYTPTAEELNNPDNIVIWYLDESTSTPVPIPYCKYDPATGKVTFVITHFSKYAIAYVMPALTDIGSFNWAEKQINAVVAKGILKPGTETTFNPGKNVTRAEFIYGLIRSLGLNAKFKDNFSDVSSADYYYTELGTARKLGIAEGLGDNRFNPGSTITRQDMMVLTARALKTAGKLDITASTDLGRFTDSSEIADYAKESVGKITADGIIIGSGNKINPKGMTGRAEAAVILFRISKK